MLASFLATTTARVQPGVGPWSSGGEITAAIARTFSGPAWMPGARRPVWSLTKSRPSLKTNCTLPDTSASLMSAAC